MYFLCFTFDKTLKGFAKNEGKKNIFFFVLIFCYCVKNLSKFVLPNGYGVDKFNVT